MQVHLASLHFHEEVAVASQPVGDAGLLLAEPVVVGNANKVNVRVR